MIQSQGGSPTEMHVVQDLHTDQN